MGKILGVIRYLGDECVLVYVQPKEGDWILTEDKKSKDLYEVVKFRECDFVSCYDNASYHMNEEEPPDDENLDENLKEVPTLHSYVNELLSLSAEILEISRDSSQYERINELTATIDEILIEMRHGNWSHVVG